MLELINVCKTFNPGTVNAKTALNDQRGREVDYAERHCGLVPDRQRQNRH